MGIDMNTIDYLTVHGKVNPTRKPDTRTRHDNNGNEQLTEYKRTVAAAPIVVQDHGWESAVLRERFGFVNAADVAETVRLMMRGK
jgi:hypothetical protein